MGIHFKKLTVRNIGNGPVISVIGDEVEGTVPSDTNLTLEDVQLDAQCCDVILSPYGHVLITNSRLEGENDILGGIFKSLTINGSDILLYREITAFNAGKAVFVTLLYDSLIEDSLIMSKAHSLSDPATGNGTALRVGSANGAILTIRNSMLASDSGAGGTALHLANAISGPGAAVYLEGSRLLARSRSISTDIQMQTTDKVTLKCTEYATVTGGGTPTVLPCP